MREIFQRRTCPDCKGHKLSFRTPNGMILHATLAGPPAPAFVVCITCDGSGYIVGSRETGWSPGERAHIGL